MAVYIYERIDIEGGGRGRFIELIRSAWAAHVQECYGVRLAGVWATVGSTATWPEADLLWEMEDWSHFARAQQGQYPLEDKDAFGTELWFQALEYRQHGTALLLEPAPSLASPPAGAALPRPGSIFIYEDVRARPGALDAYHAGLAREYLPLAEARGLELFGAYRYALRPNLGVNLWALRGGWDQWRELVETELTDPGMQRWLERCREWLEDIDGYALAVPPEQALRT
jgi:hypothetical protein